MKPSLYDLCARKDTRRNVWCLETRTHVLHHKEECNTQVCSGEVHKNSVKNILAVDYVQWR